MKPFISKTWQQRILIPLFFGLFAITLMAPIASNTTIPNTTDFMNHLAAIVQAKTALREGQFPLRVAPYERSGWRYPLYQFSSPSSYTFGGLIYRFLTPANPYLAYKIALWLTMMLGGIYMYRLVTWIVGSRPAALLAGVTYLASPHYITMMDRWGGFNETCALGILPMVLFYTFRCYQNPKHLFSFLITALMWYLLITIHLLTFVYTSFFVGLLLLLDLSRRHQYWKNLLSTGFAYLVGCLMAGWFLAPIALFNKFFKIALTLKSPSLYDYYNPLAGLLSVSASSPILLDGPYRIPNSPVHPAIGWPILLSIGVCCYALLNRQPSGNRQADRWMMAFLIVFFIAFWMSWSPIDFWFLLPKILVVAQYSWRLLSQVIWMGAFLTGWAIYWLFRHQLNAKHVVIGTLLITVATSSWIPILGKSAVSLEAFIKNPAIGFSRNDYLIDIDKFPQYVEKVDKLFLESAITNNQLVLNRDITLKLSYYQQAYSPQIHLEGTIPNEVATTPQQLSALINGVVIATKELTKPGPLLWDIPLQHLPIAESAKFLKLRFQLNKLTADKKTIVTPPLTTKIPVKNINMDGFLAPSTTIFVNDMKNHCRPIGDTISCVIYAPPATTLMELPAIYYPQMMEITLNNQSVTYHSILYEYYAIAAITPKPGAMNTITIRFHGLVWANWLSRICWLLWGLVLLVVIFQLLQKKFVTNENLESL